MCAVVEKHFYNTLSPKIVIDHHFKTYKMQSRFHVKIQNLVMQAVENLHLVQQL